MGGRTAGEALAGGAVVVRPAVGRFDDLARVIGVTRPGASGCWCMSYRDTRVPNDERPDAMRRECASEPGPGVLAYVGDEVVSGYVGTAALFERAGFERAAPTTAHAGHRPRWVLRKDLAAASDG